MAAHSSILAWRIPRTRQPMGSQMTERLSLSFQSLLHQVRLSSGFCHFYFLKKVLSARDCGGWGYFSLRQLLPLQATDYRHTGFSSTVLGLRSCGPQAQLPFRMWNLPKPGISEPYPLHWQVNSHPLCHQRNPLISTFDKDSIHSENEWLNMVSSATVLTF